ncbi:MAG TPA: hypothetical protein DDZ80_14880 [Cyanobacteria bacterium UBA8803]|nr:hypothetical protein [Cyanobacteria bacterium UBA9273]HBL59715.1 hypothetical protein [Cyanobacteria bacterium UBA8803]
MYNQEQIQELFGNEVLEYLKNKNKGGRVNEKGNTYENFFTVYKLALLSREVLEDEKELSFASQIMTFVDDLIINYLQENFCQHYQLKNTSNLRWGTGLRSIADDFAKQYELNQAVSRRSEITLVVSDSELRERLATDIPEEIAEFSKVNYFHFAPSLPKVLQEEHEFRKAVEYLCAFDNPEPDKVECVASVILGAWVSSDKSNISVVELLEKARQSQPSYIRYLGSQDVQLDPEVKTILAQIEYFTYSISRGFFQWQFANGLEEGTLSYSCETESFRRFQERIKRIKPTTFEELEILF